MIDHTIVRISSTSMIKTPAPLWKQSTCADKFCGSRLISVSRITVAPVASSLNPQEEERAEGDTPGGGNILKTSPGVPLTFRVLGGNPESRQ